MHVVLQKCSAHMDHQKNRSRQTTPLRSLKSKDAAAQPEMLVQSQVHAITQGPTTLQDGHGSLALTTPAH